MSEYSITYIHAIQCTLPCSRSCWVCFGTDAEDPGKQWTSPCRCRGATKWVHQVCLQHWIDEKQRGASSVEVQCPQCMYTYRITYPGLSVLLYLYEQLNQVISFCSPMILAGITASSLYWMSVTYGVASLSAALGREQSIQFFSDPSSSLAVVCLPLLPWGILGLKVVRLEVQVLRLWHRLVVPVLYGLLKRLPGVRLLDLRPTLYTPTPVAIFPHVSRCIVGTFALPVVSCLLGWAYSNFLHKMSSFKRTLLVSHTVVRICLCIYICCDVFMSREVQATCWLVTLQRYVWSITELPPSHGEGTHQQTMLLLSQ